MTNPQTKENTSEKAANLSARLMAVQAVYQALQNDQSITDAGREYLNHRISMEVEGETIVEPNRALVSKIVQGLDERLDEIKPILEHHLGEGKKEPELLLQAVLYCGIYELFAHHDTNVGIIINDYLNVTHGFFEQGESAFINGILDSAAKSLRNA